MLAKDVMNKNPRVVLKKDERVMDALRKMYEKGVIAAPVVDDYGKVVGIFLLRNLLKYLESRYRELNIFIPPTPFDVIEIPVSPKPESLKDVFKKLLNMKVHELSCNAKVVKPENDLEDVIDILLNKKTNIVPVVDEDCRLVGIITQMDIMKAMFKNKNHSSSNSSSSSS